MDLGTLSVSIVPAHGSPLRALDLSRDGAVLATASETGTLLRVWSAVNCNKTAELRRGVDPAAIFSLAISPSSSLLAVTSDKSTLHIFDLPGAAPRPTSARARPDADSAGSHKWGVLSKLPLLPRTFSDTYSFASAHFEMGDEPLGWTASRSPTWSAPIPGVPGGRPPQGLLGWLDDASLVVVGAGQDARWEKFVVGSAADGRRVCFREGWRKYLD